MRLRYRLILLIVLAALVPLLLTSLSATRIADKQSVELVEDLHRERAEGLAAYTGAWLADHLQGLSLAGSAWSVTSLEPEGRLQFLRLIYRQYASVNVALLLGSDGKVLAPPIFLSELPDDDPELSLHEAVDAARIPALSQRLPISAALSSGGAIGRAWRPPASASAALPVALSLDGGDAVLAAELSLAEISDYFRNIQLRSAGVAALMSDESELLAGGGQDMIDLEILKTFQGDVAGEARYTLEDGTEVLAAFAPVDGTPWTVVVAVPARIATEAGRAIQRQLLFLFGVALLVAGALGWLGALQIARPVVGLKDAALSVAEGDLGLRLGPEGAREIQELTHAFNFMSRRLEQNRDKIALQRDEIEAFNRELQGRVEERTRELREAQARLVQSSRMAAVAHMGAGLAHELNNPVAGILGMAQICRVRYGDGPLAGMLKVVEEQALRCREILATLQRLTTERADDAVLVDLQTLLDEVLALSREEFAQKEIRVERAPGEPLICLGAPGQLGQALAQLLRSLRADLETGGAIRIEGVAREGEVALRFVLEGQTSARRDDWLASGMGYWVARQTLDRHGGRLNEAVDDGIYEVILPAQV